MKITGIYGCGELPDRAIQRGMFYFCSEKREEFLFVSLRLSYESAAIAVAADLHASSKNLR
jgi:hypothetical protein